MIYYRVRKDLLPTPSKSHYTFNLRDIWKVMQGICNANQKLCTEVKDIARIFCHESMRVYHDRLTTEEDREYLKQLLASQIPNFSGSKVEDVLDQPRILYGDFLQGRDQDPRVYQQVTDLQGLLVKMQEF